jgi:predicted adenylyl cyclase CyaB
MANARLEVEAKARVNDPALVLPALMRMGHELEPIDYEDAYYIPGDAEGYSYRRFRVRRGGARTTVTAKERVPAERGETSREWEFEVSDRERFVGFMRVFGFKLLLTKRKRGRRFAITPGPGDACRAEAVAELVEIEGLGHFLEIEVMVDAEDEVAAARARVEAIFAQLGISPEEFVSTPYTLMLDEKSRG